MNNLPNTDSIRLFKADDMAAYIPQIDPEEAEELIEEVEENSEEVFAIGLKATEEDEEKVIGFAYIEDDDEGFYYVYIFPEYRHKRYGYAAACDDSLVATTEYGRELTAVVAKDNVMGCQFHPEKSGNVGLKILRAFSEMA